MVIETPFNRDIFNYHNQLNFDLVWKKDSKNNQRIIIFGSLGLLLGGLMVFCENYIGFLFIGIGIHYFLNLYYYWSHYSKNKNYTSTN